MNNEKEPSLKQRNMLIAYQESRKDLDWPTLECALLMLKLASNMADKMCASKTPNNTPTNTPAG